MAFSRSVCPLGAAARQVGERGLGARLRVEAVRLYCSETCHAMINSFYI